MFSWLSPQQRLSLVADVARGLLCPGEPLPPETIQHYAAYLAIVATLNVELEVEMDDRYNREVGEDLIPDAETMKSYRRNKKLSVAEREERLREMDLNVKLGAKNKKKIDKIQEDVIDDPLAAVGDLKSKQPNEKEAMEIMRLLFDGGPASAESRKHTRELTRSEIEYGFHYRLLCDKAFQENKYRTSPMPLCQVNFNWKSYDYDKWKNAVELLFITFQGSAKESEMALIFGKIDESSYADKSQHRRILAVKKVVKDLRDGFDPTWDPLKSSSAQREIFAICSCEEFCSEEHGPWLDELVNRLQSRGIQFHEPGHYDTRLAVYREIVTAGLHEEGLKEPYENSFSAVKGDPKNYHGDDSIFSSCAGDGCWSFNRQLQYCAKCRVVKYCSRECQGNI